MKTDDLVAMLAAEAGPVRQGAASRRLGLAMLIGLPLSFAWMLFDLGVRPDLVHALFWPMLWVKLIFPACIAVAGFLAAQRLARPGVPVRKAWAGMAAPVLLIWALALATWFAAAPDDRAQMFWGQSWRVCAMNIMLISVPILAGALVALKGLAPTRPALAGAAAGAMAGGAAASVYALHCQELAAPFLGFWYVIGIGAVVGIGALLGPKVLRW